jgi:hypothetical protein
MKFYVLAKVLVGTTQSQLSPVGDGLSVAQDVVLGRDSRDEPVPQSLP